MHHNPARNIHARNLCIALNLVKKLSALETQTATEVKEKNTEERQAESQKQKAEN
jgi:hypothetical protein